MDRFVIRKTKIPTPQVEDSSSAKATTSSATVSSNPTIMSENDVSAHSKSQSNTFHSVDISDLAQSADEPPHKIKKKAYKQKFRKEWKNEFEWLEMDNEDACCKACRTTIRGGLTHLYRHEKSASHKHNIEKSKSTPKITEYCKEADDLLEKSVKRAELKFVGFLHEHNLPFLLMDHMILLLISIFPDSQIAKGLKCGRTKSTKITKNCLAAEQISSLSHIFQNVPFSLIIDETTDVGTQKSLVLVARYFDKLQNRCRDIFLGLVRVKNCTSLALFQIVCEYLTKLHVPMNNLMGLAADNASVMMGNIGGVQAHVKNMLPNIFVLGCTCHSFHLCSSSAAKKLPRGLEDFLRAVYNYFSHSSKRRENFEKFQVFVNLKPHKMLHPSQTRWLSLQAAVDRILENWDALTLYFRMECYEEDLNSIRTILSSFEHPSYKLYFTFLSYILDIMNNLNLEFQAEKPKIFKLITKVSDLYRGLLRNFIKKDYIDMTELNNVECSNPKKFLKLETMYFGAKAEVLIAKENIDKVEIHNFRLKSLDFYIELTTQIKKRFNFEDPILSFLKILNPEIAVSGEVGSIVLPARKYFPHLIEDIEKLNSEWRMLGDLTDFKKLDLSDFEIFWSHIFNMKNELDEQMFPHLGRLVQGLLSLPHSSAAAERQFSQVTLLKTKLRNRLEIDTLDSILHVKQLLKDNECYNWKPSVSILKRKIDYSDDS